MSEINIALAVFGAAVLAIGAFSHPIRKSILQEPLLALGIGILVGPYGLGWLDIARWGNQDKILEEVSRVTLAIGLMGVALRTTWQQIQLLWRPVVLLLTLGMAGMWFASSALAAWILGLPFWIAAVLGAAVTPTDPIVATSIVSGKFAKEHLPEKVRATLSMESGANDGLAYMFIMLPILMLQQSSEPALRDWVQQTFFVAIVLAAAIGAALGYAAAKLLHWLTGRELIGSYSYLTFTVSLSLFTLGAASLVGAEALISVFVAGLTFSIASDTGEKHQEENVQEAVSMLFTLPMFSIFGLALPWEAWSQQGWVLAGFAVAVLLLRRLPILTAMIPLLRGVLGTRDVLYLGWFGPVGVAAIYYAMFAVRHTGETIIWEAVSAAVVASILAHGLTAAPLSRLYAKLER